MINSYADAVVVSGEYSFLADSISKFYTKEIIQTKANPYLDPKIAYHPDMQFIDFGKTVFILKGSEYLEDYFRNLGKHIIYTSVPSKKYPKDVLCNGKVIGNNFVCNKKTIFSGILDYAKETGYNIINVKQGYTGCSIFSISPNTALTGDTGIYSKLKEFGLNSILLSDAKDIVLPGYDCGFIGGAGGFCGNSCACLTGNFKSNKAMRSILGIFEENSIELNVLSTETIIDVGGIIPLYKNII